MATKTFIQAQLNASDLNTYALKGDTYIASASITAGSITSPFASTYDAFKIVVSNFFATADCYLWLRFGQTTGHYSGGAYQQYSTTTVTTYSQNNASFLQICAGTTAATGFPNSAVMNISRLGSSSTKGYTCQSTLHLSTGQYAWSHMGMFTYAGLAGNLTWGTTAGAVSSGTITVYGVMNP